jgi:hypothetical protein
MPVTTRIVGILLVVVGLGSYYLTGRTSVTALIPAFFGVIFIVLALIARAETARKHAMHAAVALALVGFLGTVSRLGPAFSEGQVMRPAVMAQLITAALLVAYVALGVKSFIEARRAR